MLLKRIDPETQEVIILKTAGNLTQEEFNFLCSTIRGRFGLNWKRYTDMMEYTTIAKLAAYLKKVDACGMQDNDYLDYIHWAKELGYNLRDKYYLFPKDFRKAHDRAMGIYRVEEAKRKDEEAQRFSLVIYQMAVERKKIPAFNLRSDGLMMVLPKDSKDLVREGSVLHHCVGTYTEKVAKGKTIIQCRGMRNSDPPADVRHFIHKFEDEMEKYQKQQRRGA